MLLPDNVLSGLNSDEISLVLLACHFHDLGMAGTEADNATAASREQVRKEHAISIGQRLATNWQELGFESESDASVLSEICRGHRPLRVDGVASWEDLDKHRLLGPNRHVRLRLVAAIVYAADELHLGNDRAPRREEDWKQIANAESQRHWRRHQAVIGPSIPSCAIRYDVSIATTSLEEDLRQTFRKAFAAAADLRRELATEQFANTTPKIEIRWIRDNLWKLLIITVCRDHTARTTDDIVSEVLNLFNKSTCGFTVLDDICQEEPCDDNRRRKEIARACSDFATNGNLIPTSDPNSFIFAVTSRTADALFNLTAQADEIERLFSRPIEVSHEHQLYASQLGREYIRDLVFTEIKRRYAVDIATLPETSAIRRIVESSPTTCRIIRQISTPPTTLSKFDLLRSATVAGICFDLTNNPDLILDKQLRVAIRQVFDDEAASLKRFLAFIQQLAVIKGLSVDQVGEILLESQLARDEAFAGDSHTTSINISQTIPSDRSELSFPYLILAGQRSQTRITILNSNVAPLKVSVDDASTAISRLNREAPESIQITPASETSSAFITLRALCEFDSTAGKMSFVCHQLTNSQQEHFPIIVALPAKPPKGRPNVTFSFIVPSLRVGQLLELQRASEFTESNELEVAMGFADVGEFGRMRHGSTNPFRMPTIMETSLLAALAELDPDICVPCIAPRGELDRLQALPLEERRREFETIREIPRSEKSAVTSVSLRFAKGNGQDFREEFLGMLPVDLNFSAPTVSGGGMSQGEIDGIWEAGTEEWKVTSLFREDVHELAQNLRVWVRDPRQPFPFQSDNTIQFHFCRTRLEIQHLRHIDRVWYVERPVVFRFCHASENEQYRVEMEYWRSKGDSKRADLLSELCEMSELSRVPTVVVGSSEIPPSTRTLDSIAETVTGSSTAREQGPPSRESVVD